MQRYGKNNTEIVGQPAGQASPSDQLHQIYIQGEQSNIPGVQSANQVIKASSNKNKKGNRTKFNQMTEISSWNGQSWERTESQNENIGSRSQLNQRQDRSINYKFRQFQRNSNKTGDQHQNKIMSMSQLCHRYTFVNEYGSYNRFLQFQYENRQDKLLPKYQTKNATNIQLKLPIQSNELLQIYQNQFKFFEERQTRQIRFPLIGAHSGNSSISNKHRQNKSTEVNLFGNSSKSKNICQKSSSQQKLKSNIKLHCSEKKEQNGNQQQKQKQKGDAGQKIYWKNKLANDVNLAQYDEKANKNRKICVLLGSQYHKNAKRQTQRNGIIKGSINQISKHPERQLKKNNLTKAERRRLSKSLQQCLILRKNT